MSKKAKRKNESLLGGRRLIQAKYQFHRGICLSRGFGVARSSPGE
jgi:hypothetical protein